ncbi:MAG: hypothetical protein LBQ81_02150 [Zoogloeaceae bacterium]|jgi:hypothetical protein|nr:hypothetical protein [Zoogloeaceae bacterium]
MSSDSSTVPTDVSVSWKIRYFSYVLLGVTVLLVFFEFKYNTALLSSISDPNTTPAQADDLSQRGKLLASFGLTWALFRNLLFKARHFIVGVLGLALITFAGYWALDTLYDKVIDSLKPEIKVMGFNLLSYRHDLLTGELEDPDIPRVEDEPVTGKIFMGAFPIVLLDDRFMVPAQDIVARKADEKQAEVLEISEEKWNDYAKNMTALRAAYDRYIDSSRKVSGKGLEADWANYRGEMEKLTAAYERYHDASLRAHGKANLEQEWARYNGNMNSIRTSYREYINNSRRAERYGSRGADEFRRQSGGMSPNSHLPIAQFPALIKRSSHPKASQIRQSESRIIGQHYDGKPIYAREMPYFMGRADFYGWIARRAAEGLVSAGLPADPRLSKVGFLALLRESNAQSGKELRQHEQREIGQRKDGTPVLAGEMPYFMERPAFYQWSANLANESMLALGLPPDEQCSLQEFVELLRNSPGKEGQRLREAEQQLVTKRPDGSELLVRDVPYFMNEREYHDWVIAEAESMKAMAMPTTETVDELKNIKQVNAAIFIPPMAIISSLTSALVNAISIVLFLAATVLSLSGVTAPVGRAIKKYSIVLMLSMFALLVSLMPSHIFHQGTALYDLETKLHQEVGVAAKLWSRLSNIQKYFL